MGKKKKSWLTYVKRLFISEPKTKSEKKWKNSRSLFKFRSYPAIEAPARRVNDAEEQQRRAIAVANAAAAAAEAAIAAADAAAEVARLACFSRELRRKNNLQNSAATKIQTCYRGYLARKALSALKGVVRLQAAVRGELARRNLLHVQRSRRVQLEMEIPYSKGGTLGTTKLAQLKLRSAMAKTEGRRSFRYSHEKEKSTSYRDDPSSQNAHSFRAYMATTESARAKVRSSSTPNQRRRPRLSESSQSCQESSPSKLSISSWTSFTTQLILNPTTIN